MLTIVLAHRFTARPAKTGPRTYVILLGFSHISKMADTSEAILSQAKEHFYALRLLEAYTLFRRFFDRLPFQPEKRHAEYIGMFARVLAELGKTSELKFYMGELERWHARLKDPAIAYQLAIVYSYLPEPRTESARQLFENLMRDPNAHSYRLKARMMLADYYDSKGDLPTCRQFIFGVELTEIGDPILRTMYCVWRAKILCDELKLDLADDLLTHVFQTVTLESNWYVYWWAKIILARLYHLRNDNVQTKTILSEVRNFLKASRCKSLENHVVWLTEINKRNAIAVRKKQRGLDNDPRLENEL